MRYAYPVKTTALPPIPVESAFLDVLKSVLVDGETLESFVEASVRASVERRRSARAKFIARGMRSRDEAHRSGDYADADTVCDRLQRKLDAARARIGGSPK
jgi:hypothetical protein